MSTEHIPVLLVNRHALRVHLPEGSRIVATHGTLWLTRTGDRKVEALGGLAGFLIRVEAGARRLFQRPQLLGA